MLVCNDGLFIRCDLLLLMLLLIMLLLLLEFADEMTPVPVVADDVALFAPVAPPPEGERSSLLAIAEPASDAICWAGILRLFPVVLSCCYYYCSYCYYTILDE